MNIEDLVKDDAADEIARRKDEHAATANFDAGNAQQGASELMKTGHYGKAKAMLEDALAKASPSEEKAVILALAQCLHMHGEDKAWIAMMLRALELDNRDSELQLKIGDALFDESEYSVALPHYDTAVVLLAERSPATAMASIGARRLSKMAMCAFKTSDGARAKGLCRQALVLNSEEVVAKKLLAKIVQSHRRVSLALRSDPSFNSAAAQSSTAGGGGAGSRPNLRMRVGAACDRCSTAQAETLAAMKTMHGMQLDRAETVAAMKTMHGMQLQLERQVLTRDTTIANMKSDRVLELAELRTTHARELQERELELTALRTTHAGVLQVLESAHTQELLEHKLAHAYGLQEHHGVAANVARENHERGTEIDGLNVKLDGVRRELSQSARELQERELELAEVQSAHVRALAALRTTHAGVLQVHESAHTQELLEHKLAHEYGLQEHQSAHAHELQEHHDVAAKVARENRGRGTEIDELNVKLDGVRRELSQSALLLGGEKEICAKHRGLIADLNDDARKSELVVRHLQIEMENLRTAVYTRGTEHNVELAEQKALYERDLVWKLSQIRNVADEREQQEIAAQRAAHACRCRELEVIHSRALEDSAVHTRELKAHNARLNAMEIELRAELVAHVHGMNAMEHTFRRELDEEGSVHAQEAAEYRASETVRMQVWGAAERSTCAVAGRLFARREIAEAARCDDARHAANAALARVLQAFAVEQRGGAAHAQAALDSAKAESVALRAALLATTSLDSPLGSPSSPECRRLRAALLRGAATSSPLRPEPGQPRPRAIARDGEAQERTSPSPRRRGSPNRRRAM